MFYGKYRELCALKGVSPSTAAVRAGISKSTVSVWKSKFDQGIDVDPDQQTIDKICAYFEISEAELRGFGDEGIKKDLPQMGEIGESDIRLNFRSMSTAELLELVGSAMDELRVREAAR